MTREEVQQIVTQLSQEALQVLSSLSWHGHVLAQRTGLDGWFILPIKARLDYVPTVKCDVATLKELGKHQLLQQLKDGTQAIRFVLSDRGEAVAFEIMD